MANFINRIFSSSSTESENNLTPAAGNKTDDTVTLDQNECPKAAGVRKPRRKNSANTEPHDLDPTVEMDNPDFDGRAFSAEQKERVTTPLKMLSSATPWCDPTVEVYLQD